jgi:hypothetical protein
MAAQPIAGSLSTFIWYWQGCPHKRGESPSDMTLTLAQFGKIQFFFFFCLFIFFLARDRT